MKIKQEHFDFLERNIQGTLNDLDVKSLIWDYETGNFPRSAATKDLQQRLCFDLLYAAIPDNWICKNLYPYMNDNHIYTALKRICPKVERKY